MIVKLYNEQSTLVIGFLTHFNTIKSFLGSHCTIYNFRRLFLQNKDDFLRIKFISFIENHTETFLIGCHLFKFEHILMVLSAHLFKEYNKINP